MARTNAAAVLGVLGVNYDTVNNPSLAPFIDSAAIVLTRVATCATAKGKTLTAAELELIERWLAAHLYQQMDEGYASRATSSASGSFKGQTGMRLESTMYGQTAMTLDASGCLENLGKRQTAGAFWLGRSPSEQTAYVDRS